MLLPEKAHLEALIRQVASIQSNLNVIFRLLAALMVDNELPEMRFPSHLLKRMERGFTTLDIRTEADGSVVVVRRQLPPTPPSVH